MMAEKEIYTTEFSVRYALEWELMGGRTLSHVLINAAWNRFWTQYEEDAKKIRGQPWYGKVEIPQPRKDEEPVFRVTLKVEHPQKAVYLYPIYIVKVLVDGNLTDEEAIDKAEEMLNLPKTLRGCEAAERADYTEQSDRFGVVDEGSEPDNLRWYERDGITPYDRTAT
jgi:hypothetical protein